MADFLKILESKIDFSPTEIGVAERWFRQVERDSLFANAISSSGGGGYVTSVDAGNVSIDLGEGFTLKNPDTGDNTIRFDPDGDAWFGKNIGQPDDTTMFIISNDNLYNGEQFGAGDLLIGSNSSDKGNMWWDASEGKLFFRSGTTTSVEIGDGGIIASWGKIGGWNIGATTLYDDNGGITLDSGNEKITVGSGDPHIVIDGANAYIKSSGYSADASGWMIDKDGNAEFNDITARGTLKSAVFEMDSITAVGGRIWLSKNAGALAVPFTTGTAPDADVDITINDADSGFQVAEAGDVLVMRSWNGVALVTAWMTVQSIGAQSGGATTYTVDYESGNNNSLFVVGSAIVNLGPADSGIIELRAGETATRMSIRTHAGSPWSTVTTRVVLGNMRGTYGTGANDRYGIGIGDYSSGNYLSYNAASAESFLIRAGEGRISLDVSGFIARNAGGDYTIQIDADGDAFFGSNLAAPATTAFVVFANAQNYNSGGDEEAMGAGDVLFGDNTASKANILWDKSTGKMLFRTGKVTHTYIDTDGKLTAGGGNVKISSGGIALLDSGTTASWFSWHDSNDDDIGYVYGNYGGGGGDGIMWVLANRKADDAWGGTGVILAAVDSVRGNDVRVWVDGGTETITLSGADVVIPDGDIYTEEWTDYLSSSTIVGWTSPLTAEMLFYKKVGKTVYVQFFLVGTSNSTTTSFTLPFANNADLRLITPLTRIGNNGVAGVGYGQLNQSSNLVTFFSTVNALGWNSGGSKYIEGEFFYETD